MKSIKLLVLIFMLGQKAMAQANPCATFQGYALGAIVQVRSEKPVVMLNRAALKEITASNVVVVANGERLVLDKSFTVLSDLPGSAAPSPAPVLAVPGKNVSPSEPTAGKFSTSADVPQLIFGKYANDSGYAKVTAQYQSMMNDFNSGKMSLADLATKAEKVLAEADKYKAERAKDPQYEEQIAMLHDFLKRAQAGETVTPLAPTVLPSRP